MPPNLSNTGQGSRSSNTAQDPSGSTKPANARKDGKQPLFKYKTAIVQPIQSLHANPTDPTCKPVPVTLREAMFKDWSSFVHLPRLARLAAATRPYANLSKRARDTADDHHPAKRARLEGGTGSRREQNTDPSVQVASEAAAPRASPEVEPNLDLHLASTELLFSVMLPTGCMEKDRIAAFAELSSGLKLHGRTVSLCTCNVHVQKQGKGIEGGEDLQDGMGIYKLQVREEESGDHIASLPLIDASNADYSRNSWSWTNGLWLEHAEHLVRDEVLVMRAELAARWPRAMKKDLDGSATAAAKGHAFELVLGVTLKLRRMALHHPHVASAGHLRELIRFVSPCPLREAYLSPEARQDAGSTKFVYDNLLPTKVVPRGDEQPRDLAARLLPFQLASTRFLLDRQDAPGIRRSSPSPLAGSPSQTGSEDAQLGLWWELIRTPPGAPNLFFNVLDGRVTNQDSQARAEDVCGAILAEEMGLGKTVEILAVVLAGTERAHLQLPAITFHNAELEVDVLPVCTTLIVCPEILCQQWLDETAKHAEGLKCYHFTGHVKAQRDVPKGSTWLEWASTFDIIVASYTVVSREFYVAKPEPQRSRRFERKYERARSPLVQLEFCRVVMDESQMVGHQQASDVVSLIQRRSSIAVSGTPLKQIGDLRALFRFLKALSPWKDVPWHRYIEAGNAPYLARVIQRLGTRHTKDGIRDQLRIPVQTRYLVPIELGPVQRSSYDQLLAAALEDMGLNQAGEPVNEDYEANVNKLRHHLNLLRQTCTHPQLAAWSSASSADRQVNSNNGRMFVSKHIQDMQEYLGVMRGSKAAERDSHFVGLHQARIDKAMLLMLDKDNSGWYEQAKEILLDARQQLDARIKELEANLPLSIKEGPYYRFSSAELASEGSDIDALAEQHYEESESDAVRREMLKARQINIGALKNRIRNHYEQLHRACMFLARTTASAQAMQVKASEIPMDVDVEEGKEGEAPARLAAGQEHVGVEPDSEVQNPFAAQEAEAYDHAEAVRQRMLSDSLNDVDKAIEQLKRTKLPQLMVSQAFGPPGILTASIFGWLDELVALLNKNGSVLDTWRDQIVDRLCKVVNREISLENELDDQYSENLDAQAEAEVILEMYRVVLAEREVIISGAEALDATAKPTLYVILEDQVREHKRLSLLGTTSSKNGRILGEEEYQLAVKQLHHFRSLDKQRECAKLRRDMGEMSLVETEKQLREMSSRTDSRQEMHIAREASQQARELLKTLRGTMSKLQSNAKVLARAFNTRVVYFKRIQAVSDTVRDIEVRGSLAKHMEQLETEIARRTKKLGPAQRYLQFLHKGDFEYGDGDCSVCYNPSGIQWMLESCSHYFCPDCVKRLLSERPPSRKCWRCNRPVAADVKIRTVAVTKEAADELAEARHGPLADDLDKKVYAKPQFRMMPSDLRRNLTSIRLAANHGAKIHLLIQHLLYIAQIDRAAKTIVFSSFGAGLDLVAQALQRQGVSFVKLDQSSKAGTKTIEQFRTSTDTNVLLLHAEAQSAGLNLICAKRIILLEPLVNHSRELQALGRIHRIGQQQETEVYCYMANESVEDNICNAAAGRGESLYTLDKSRSSEIQDSATIEAQHRKGDAPSQTVRASQLRQGEFINDVSLLLSCFFEEHHGRPILVSALDVGEKQHLCA
ncbi:snf2 family helicase atpase [Ceraceosorus bombacis]|uniref:Snf2 family helicase atpase n=1 Tax=Ceraceosorus bombacis TaxID=401625 RepID=A0A0P1BQJ4_9BASI|nr:snf2 family helicase atpase [Ceraceosorus bombacis]